MSTTIQYKGNTLATVSNNTKTLKTAGKYMEGDVVLTDVSGGSEAISVVDTLDTNGGTIRTITAVDISDTTAVASDVAQGKYFYTADGTKTAGTSTGGGGGGGDTNPTASKKQINFIDYDGTIRYSYTSSEWANVSALPSNPSHSGLVAQGWNWTKAQIDAQLTALPNGDVWVGQMYITQSGNTEIDVTFADSARLSPIMTICVNGTIEVDWGDNTAKNTVTGTSLSTRLEVPHTYSSTGNYTIKIHIVSGTFRFYGTSTYTLLRKNTTANENKIYANCVKAIRIGSEVTNIGSYAFYNCYSLASITIPSDVTDIASNAFGSCYALASVTAPSGIARIAGSTFYYCRSLRTLSIPSGVTSIGGGAFDSCHPLESVTVPSGVTSLGSGLFYNCYSLESVTIPSGVTILESSDFGNCCALASLEIPSGVTSIGESAFIYCYGIAEYHFKPTTPPTLGTNVFNGIASDCKIYVPSASLEAYQTAANWSTYASYMVGE